MNRPLAIDLFCGLRQTEFGHCIDAPVQQLVACRTKNPEHVAQRVPHEAMGTKARVFGAMRYLDHSVLTTGLAGDRKIRIFAPQSSEPAVSIWPTQVVTALRAWLPFVKGPSLSFRGLSSARSGTIPLVTAWWRNLKSHAAFGAIATRSSYVCLFATPKPTSAGGAALRAVAFIRALGLEVGAALGAEQVVHQEFIHVH